MWSVNKAEAAEGRHALSEEERIKAGYPAIPGMTFYSDGTAYKVTVTPPSGWSSESGWGHTGKILSYDKDSIVLDDDIISLWGGSYRYNAISAFTTSGRYTEVGKDTNANRDMFKSLKNYHLEEVCTAYEGTATSGQGSTWESHKELRNTCSYKLVPLNTGANSEDVKKFMKEAGVDAEGETVKITKPMETQDINVDGRITTTGDIEAGGDVIVHGSETIDRNLTVKGDKTVNGNSTVGKDSHIKGNETVDKNLTVHGSETVDGNSHVKGNSETDGNSTTHGNATFDKNVKIKGDTSMDGKLDVGGDTHMHSNAEIDKNLRVHGNEEVDGDSHIHGNSEIDKDQTVHGNQHINGNQEVDKDATVYGNTNLKGDLRVEGNSRLLDDVQIGDDKNKDKFDVWAKTHLHGDTTVGDDDKDKFTVNATSEFKADATFDKDVKIKGDLEMDGNSTTHGNATIDKDLHVKGNSETDGNALVHGNGVIEGDFEVKGSTKLGDDKNKDTLDVNAKTHLHGDTTIGDDKNDKLTVNATTEFTGESSFGKDVHIKGNLETDGDSRTHGNSVTDGNAIVYGNAGIAQNLTVGGNSHVFGDSVVDGDIYGRSFNVGNERYIDKDGINANNHKIRNVADGEIGPNSLDAVNGRQLWHTREALQHNVNQVGAQTAAMANLHPIDFEYGDKFSLAAAVGGYQDQQAFALGAFMKPTQKSMVSLTGTLGMSQNMYGVGYTQKFGKKSDFEHMTETQLKDELTKLDKDAAEIREHDKQIKAENETLRKESRVLAESIDANSAEIGRLKVADEKMRAENVALRDENKALKGEIAELKADNKELTKNLAQNSKGDTEMRAKLAQSEEKVSFLQKAVDGLKAQLMAMAEKIGK